MNPRSGFFHAPTTARFLGLGLLWVGSALSSWLPAQESGHMPVSPRILLEALPRSVDNWTLRESRGGSDLGAVWLESYAVRRFEPSGRPGGSGSPGGKFVTLSVLDTAAHPGSDLEIFAGFAPGKAAGEEWVFVRVDGRPALVPRSGETMPNEMRVLVAGRFLVTLRMEGGVAGGMRFWLEQLDFERLERIPIGPLVPLPSGFSAIDIDELSGKSESDQTVSIGTSLLGEGIDESAPDPED